MAKKAPAQAVVSVGLAEPRAEFFERDGKRYRKWKFTPPTKEEAAKIFWRPIYCGGFDVGENGEKLYHHIECLPCHCVPGPHYWALRSPAFEIGCGGARGAGKSEDLLAFFSKGDPSSPVELLQASYLNSPDYKFLALRKNATDLVDFFERAKRYFAKWGGVAKQEPQRRIDFPSGAYGLFDHLNDENAFEKYQGHEYARLGVEEIQLIPREEDYLKVLMCCRSSNPAMREQAMVTFNPKGAGAKWIKARFVKMRFADGRLVRRYDRTGEGQLFTDSVTGQTRIFVWSSVEDNPYEMRKGYDRTLDMLRMNSESQWRAWRLGDFDVVDGAFFGSFRKEPHPEEPAHACHVIKAGSVELLPWWPRAISCDWGFSHKCATYWGCWSPKRQLHVHDEMVLSGVGTLDIGARIAERTIPILRRMESPRLVMHLSPDAFSRTDNVLTEAEMIAQGIEKVLGKGMAFVAAPSLEEESLDKEEARRAIEERLLTSKASITIVRAVNNRKPGWQLLREYLRWWKLPSEPNAEDLKLLLQTKGHLAVEDYVRRLRESEAQTLPALQIWDCCEHLIEGLINAQESETDSEDVRKKDDDEIDSLRYLVMGFRFGVAQMPKDLWVSERIRNVMENIPAFARSLNSMIHVADRAEQEFKKQNTARSVTLARPIGNTFRKARYLARVQ